MLVETAEQGTMPLTDTIYDINLAKVAKSDGKHGLTIDGFYTSDWDCFAPFVTFCNLLTKEKTKI